MAKIRRINFTLLTQSGWIQDQDSGSLSDLPCASFTRLWLAGPTPGVAQRWKGGEFVVATEVPEASEATDHVFFPEAVSSARSGTATGRFQFVQCLNSPDSETGDRCPQ